MTGKMLSKEPTIHPTSIVQETILGEWTELGPNTHIQESIFGDYSYTAEDAQIIYTEIGKFCSIASHVRINPGNHPMWRVSQHHATYRRAQYGFGETDDEEIFMWRKNHKVTIGHDVWIGHGAIIMPGVSIGTGAVIGAGAVVTKDVSPYMIAVGVPAKPLHERFSKDVVEKLLAIKWWNWDRATLEERFHLLKDTDDFIEKFS